MKLKTILLAATASLILTACGGSEPAPQVNPEPASGDATLPTEFCYFPGEAPQGNVQFTLLKNVKAAKGTFGSVSAVIPKLESAAIARGGNAVINFNASQRFGFWPWRLVRPVARGRAIKITNTNGLSCHEMGGFNQAEALER